MISKMEVLGSKVPVAQQRKLPLKSFRFQKASPEFQCIWSRVAFAKCTGILSLPNGRIFSKEKFEQPSSHPMARPPPMILKQVTSGISRKGTVTCCNVWRTNLDTFY